MIHSLQINNTRIHKDESPTENWVKNVFLEVDSTVSSDILSAELEKVL